MQGCRLHRETRDTESVAEPRHLQHQGELVDFGHGAWRHPGRIADLDLFGTDSRRRGEKPHVESAMHVEWAPDARCDEADQSRSAVAGLKRCRQARGDRAGPTSRRVVRRAP